MTAYRYVENQLKEDMMSDQLKIESLEKQENIMWMLQLAKLLEEKTYNDIIRTLMTKNINT